MDGLEGLAAMMAACGGMDLKPIAESDLDKGFQPIADLKPGEKVRAKSERYNNYKTCKDGAVITVHRVGMFDENEKDASVDANDFTALFGDEARVVEFAFDSRRFERAE